MTGDGTARPPGLAAQLALLWGLRLRLAASALHGASPLVATTLGALALAAATAGAGRLSYALLLHPAVLADPPLRVFLLLLLGFLASTLWIVWPALTAGVDDSAELSRFALLPVARGRVFLASVLAGLVEPRVLPLWGALVGATAAVHAGGGLSLPLSAASLLALGLCGVVWGRVGLHLLLDVLRHRRSAEAIGAGLLGLLLLTTLVPPPDLSWLKTLATAEPNVDRRLLAGASALFVLLPTGGWAGSLLAQETGRWGLALAFPAWTALWALAGHVLALRLLERFHRGAGRALPQPVPPEPRAPAFSGRSVAAVLLEREVREVLANPRVRIMVAMPFLLAILIQLSGGRALAAALTGERADAWVLGGLLSYGALLLAGGLGQNLFGYDGAGVRLLLAAPVPVRALLVAKNVAHVGAALVVCALASAFYALRVGSPSPALVAIVLVQTAWQAVLLVAAGNVLSVLAPRRFHTSLRRRDRPPAVTLVATMALAAAAVAPWTVAVRGFAGADPGPAAWALTGALLVAALGLWRASVGLAERLLRRRRPELVHALARD